MAACPAAKVLASVNEIELFRSLDFVMEQLYTLWELVITAEPIVVVGTSPADCSHMVQTLLAMIAPLEYCAEARPYFTIHDSEFREFTQECSSKTTLPACILGVTNPFFVKLLKDWPHMLRLVDNQVSVPIPVNAIQNISVLLVFRRTCSSNSICCWAKNTQGISHRPHPFPVQRNSVAV